MNREDKVDYLRIALGLQKIGVNNKVADQIIETYEQILKLEDGFSIKDAVEIELAMDRKYKEKELQS